MSDKSPRCLPWSRYGKSRSPDRPRRSVFQPKSRGRRRSSQQADFRQPWERDPRCRRGPAWTLPTSAPILPPPEPNTGPRHHSRSTRTSRRRTNKEWICHRASSHKVADCHCSKRAPPVCASERLRMPGKAVQGTEHHPSRHATQTRTVRRRVRKRVTRHPSLPLPTTSSPTLAQTLTRRRLL